MTDGQEHTFLFADLAGFTALTEVHGDEEAVQLVEHVAHRQRHVVAGIAVGDREDVQVVDLLAALLQVRAGD